MIDFEQYIKQKKPDKREGGYAWQTAIGKGSSEICCWVTVENFVTVIFILMYLGNGASCLIFPMQAQDKCRTSTGQVEISPKIERLVKILEQNQLSTKTIMEKMQLKGRDNFLNLYLNPAIASGFVTLLYPDKPRHSRQKFFFYYGGFTKSHQAGDQMEMPETLFDDIITNRKID